MRCYNGCPDDKLAAIWDSRAKAKERARKLGYGITYFPAEECYSGYKLTDYTPVTPDLNSVEACLDYIEAHCIN